MKCKQVGSDVYFYCPGCDENHSVRIPPWTFDGNFDKPTITPSLVWNSDQGNPKRCHLNITNGEIIYHMDCFHDFKSRTIDMREYRDPSNSSS